MRGQARYGMLHFMRLSLVAKRRLLVLILAIGAVLAVVLAVTRFDPIATTGGAPVSLLNSPDLATVGADKSAPFYNPKPVAEYTLPGTVRRVEDVAGAPPGIKVQRMVYMSQTAAGEAKEVSALFAVKDGAPPPPNGRPLITVAHGTSELFPAVASQKEPFRLGSERLLLVVLLHRTVGPSRIRRRDVWTTETSVLRCVRLHREERSGSRRLECRSRGSEAGRTGHRREQGGDRWAPVRAGTTRWPPPRWLRARPGAADQGDRGPGAGLFPPAPLMKVFLQMGPGAGPDGTADFAAHLADAVVSWSANYPERNQAFRCAHRKGCKRSRRLRPTASWKHARRSTGRIRDFVKPDITANIAGIVSKNMPVYDKFAAPC